MRYVCYAIGLGILTLLGWMISHIDTMSTAIVLLVWIVPMYIFPMATIWVRMRNYHTYMLRLYETFLHSETYDSVTEAHWQASRKLEKYHKKYRTSEAIVPFPVVVNRYMFLSVIPIANLFAMTDMWTPNMFPWHRSLEFYLKERKQERREQNKEKVRKRDQLAYMHVSRQVDDPIPERKEND